MINNEKIILYKTKHKQVGRRHDYKIYKENRPDIPKDVVESIVDLGFLGVEKDYPEQISSLPIKKEERESRFNYRGKRIQQNSF